MDSLNFNKLGLGLIFAGMASLVALPTSLGQDLASKVGLSLFSVGFLIMVFGVVMGRLKKLGAEYWAVGSFFVYLGFIIGSIPIFIFIISQDLVEIWIQWVIFFVGFALVILGFGTEMYDLNVAFLAFFRKIGSIFSYAWSKFIERITKSVLTLPILLLVFYLLSMPFTQSEKYLVDLTGGSITDVQAALIVGGLLLILVSIEARELIMSSAVVTGKFLKLIGKTFVHWIYHLPSILSKFFSILWKSIKSLLLNNWIIGAVGAPIFLVLGLVYKNNSSLAIALFFTLLSFGLFSLSKPESIGRVVTGVGDRVIKRKLRVKKYVKEHPTVPCRNCGHPLSHSEMLADTCKWCGASIEKCVVCYSMIGMEDNAISCPHCQNSGHLEHLEGWTDITGKCPYCRQPWRIRSN